MKLQRLKLVEICLKQNCLESNYFFEPGFKAGLGAGGHSKRLAFETSKE